MEEASASERPSFSRLMSLQLHLLRKIYSFAVLEPHFFSSTVYYSKLHRHSPHNVEPSLGLHFPREYTLKTHRSQLLNVCREFRAEIGKLFYSKNSFSFSSRQDTPSSGARGISVQLERIERCRLRVDLAGYSDQDDGVLHGPFTSVGKRHNFKSFVATLVAKGHRLKYLLFECAPLFLEWLQEGLRAQPALPHRLRDPVMQLRP